MTRTPPFYGPIEWFGLRYSQMYGRITRAPRHALRTWLAASNQVSRTNCWWAVYAAADWIKPQIEQELRCRDQRIQRRLSERKIPHAFAGIPTPSNGGEQHG